MYFVWSGSGLESIIFLSYVSKGSMNAFSLVKIILNVVCYGRWWWWTKLQVFCASDAMHSVMCAVCLLYKEGKKSASSVIHMGVCVEKVNVKPGHQIGFLFKYFAIKSI